MSFYKRVTLTLFYYLIKGKVSFIIDKYTKEGTIHNSAYAFYANFWTPITVDVSDLGISSQRGYLLG